MTIKILTTGGTIASKDESDTEVSKMFLSGEEMAESIPEINSVANISIEAICNIHSYNIDLNIWKRISERVNDALVEHDTMGVVITHGTDTMEETAFFLDLTVKSSKPVVLTGAQRCASDWDSDGQRNLLNAVKIAAAKNTRKMGVLVSLNGQIYSAWDVTKTHTLAVETFNAGPNGLLGEVVGDQVRYYRNPIHRVNFPLKSINPNIDIITMYPGADGRYIDYAVKSGLSGIVIQGLGAGNVNALLFKSIKNALKNNVTVVVSTRVPYGPALPLWGFEGGGLNLKEHGAIFSNSLSPWKSRILLMLSINTVKNEEELQNIFDLY
jgi:L-asparaginase